MKVLHVIVGLDVGGAEMALYRLLTCRADLSHERTVVSLTTLGSIGERLQQQGFVVHTLGMRGGRDVFAAMLSLYRLVRRLRPDVVQTWMYHADLIGGVASKLAGVTRVIWGIRTLELDAGAPRSTRWVRAMCARLSPCIPDDIVCVAVAAKHSHQRLGYAEDKMRVIPNGYVCDSYTRATAARSSVRAALGLASNEVLIGSVGRWHPDKDHEGLLAALERVCAQHRYVKVILIGRGLTAANGELMQAIQTRGLVDRILLLGERSDVPECLSAMDLYCLHSRREAFPNALAEAMASGLPCVATDVGDAASLLAGCGRIVVAGDPVALANGLDELLTLPEAERRQLGQRAACHIQREYSIEACFAKFESLYSYSGKA